jgi:hypothetical protein
MPPAMGAAWTGAGISETILEINNLGMGISGTTWEINDLRQIMDNG